jgi:hypothetical protein
MIKATTVKAIQPRVHIADARHIEADLALSAAGFAKNG